MENKLTPLQKKLLNEIIIPSITREKQFPYENKLFTMADFSETLNFTTLLGRIKAFYKSNGGKDWHKVYYEGLG